MDWPRVCVIISPNLVVDQALYSDYTPPGNPSYTDDGRIPVAYLKEKSLFLETSILSEQYAGLIE
jgi:hypothetical protein